MAFYVNSLGLGSPVCKMGYYMPIIKIKWGNTSKPLAILADRVNSQQIQVKILFPTEIGFFFIDLVLIIHTLNGGKRVTEHYPSGNERYTHTHILLQPR